jgi:hypothetical protein
VVHTLEKDFGIIIGKVHERAFSGDDGLRADIVVCQSSAIPNGPQAHALLLHSFILLLNLSELLVQGMIDRNIRHPVPVEIPASDLEVPQHVRVLQVQRTNQTSGR